jgi:hypothetical protein
LFAGVVVVVLEEPLTSLLEELFIEEFGEVEFGEVLVVFEFVVDVPFVGSVVVVLLVVEEPADMSAAIAVVATNAVAIIVNAINFFIIENSLW